jgi:flavin reductase (DIM6/NTAB) family NADH-FMN oxidoreductase RutF
VKRVVRDRLPRSYYHLLRPSRPVLVTTKNEDGSLNVAPFSWIMPVSSSPPIIALSLKTIPEKQNSLVNIETTQEFGVNIPHMELAGKLIRASFSYPKNTGKFQVVGFTEEEPVSITTQLVRECKANFECKVERIDCIGDHSLIIANVVAMHYSEEYYSEDMLLDLSKVTPCLHMGRYVENDGEKHIFMVGVDTREVFEEY